MLELIDTFVKRRRKRERAVQGVSEQFWTLVENRNLDIALAGNRWAIRALTAHADAEQRGRVRQAWSLLRILIAWKPPAVEAGVDCIVVPHQRFKLAIARRLRKRSGSIPVHVLYECVLVTQMMRRRSPAADIESAPAPKQTYVIASSRRTGSSMLCSMLREAGHFGYPGEYIQVKTSVLAEQRIIDAGSMLTSAMKIDQTPNGVFGIKTHWSALERFHAAVGPLLNDREQSAVRDLYERSAYIFLTRRNKIRQAISDWRARRSGVFYVPRGASETWKEKHGQGQPYKYGAIKHHLKNLIADEEHWKQDFEAHGIVPVEVVYEDMVDAPGDTVGRIARHLGLERTQFDVKPRSKRLADKQTEVIYERFVGDLVEELGEEIVFELTGSRPQTKHRGERRATRERESRHVLVTLATRDYLDKAKQLFASAYFNAGWNGDYLLLAHDIPESELSWFRDKGILVKSCAPLYDGRPGGMHACLADKLYLFTPEFKRWDTVIYTDLDVIIRAPLDELKDAEGFCAVEDWSPTLREQIVKRSDIESRGLDAQACRALIRDTEKRFKLSRRPFCAGVFAFSTDIIEDDTFERLKQTLDKYESISKFGDQLAMNLFFHDRWIKLRPTFDVLVRQEHVISPYENSLVVSTRWGLVNQLDAYILHVFNPKPWNVTSHYYVEWLANLKQAESLDLADVPAPDPERLAQVKRTETRIRVREQLYDWAEWFGPYKVRAIGVLRFLYWRSIFLKRVAHFAVNTARSVIRGPSLDK